MIIYAYKKRENSQKSNKYTRYILATFFCKILFYSKANKYDGPSCEAANTSVP